MRQAVWFMKRRCKELKVSVLLTEDEMRERERATSE